MRQNFYEFSLHRQTDLDDRIVDCLLTSLAVQAEVVRASFQFVGDLNSRHQEWLGFATTNRHGVTAFVIATVSFCYHLVVSPTHAYGGTPSLDLLMTDVSHQGRVIVVAPIDCTDYSSMLAVISRAQAVSNFCVSWKVFLKHQVN